MQDDRSIVIDPWRHVQGDSREERLGVESRCLSGGLGAEGGGASRLAARNLRDE